MARSLGSRSRAAGTDVSLRDTAGTMIDFVGLRPYFGLISLSILAPCLVALAIWQFSPGIDFVGGVEIEARFVRAVTPEEVSAAVDDLSVDQGDLAVEVEPGDAGSFLVTYSFHEVNDSDAFVQAQQDRLNERLAPTSFVDVFETNGSVEVEVWFPADVDQEQVRDSLDGIGQGDARVQPTEDSTFKVRLQEPDDGDTASLRDEAIAKLEADVGSLAVLRADLVSGVLSSEIARDAAIAVAVAAIAIVIYISLAFRRLPKPLLYGVASLIALVHDVTIVTGIFAILGETSGYEVNAMFVTALLAVIGYSVNDTIVVFDRIRELLLEERGTIRESVNAALTQTLGRSLNTSITLVVALIALFLVGGVTIRPFVLVLLVGAIAGTYSSIAVAAQVVVLWEEGSIQRRLFFQRDDDDSVKARRSPA